MVMQVVLVGHSMAGFALAQIMERFSHKISFAVFIAAVLSSSGVPLTNDTPLYAIVRLTLTNSLEFSNKSIFGVNHLFNSCLL